MPSLIKLVTLLTATATLVAGKACKPVAQAKNGTYAGVYSPGYDQDFFLGVQFAQAPAGDLRFRNPQSLNQSWTGVKFAESPGPECPGNGPYLGYNYSEDCLYMNIIRPHGVDYSKTKLPVAVWIHGGGFSMGGADQRFNLSFIVQHSVEIGNPIMAVSVNYRLGGWGFLNSDELHKDGSSNMGIRDQRLGLHWIQENIGGFGGDSKAVTIWGESAGAASVGLHVTAYNGRDDGLFRGAIMQSGNPIYYGPSSPTETNQDRFSKLLAGTGCNDTADALACLRALPYDTINNVLNTTALSNWQPQIDGDIFARFTSEQIADGAFAHVPILLGANSDEGGSFGTRGINTDEDFLKSLTSTGVPQALADKLAGFYTTNMSDPVLAFLGQGFVAPENPSGKQWQRSATYGGDKTFIANRRLSCETWAAAGLPAYCFRFNAVPQPQNALTGVAHFAEMGFVFLNLDGVGYINPTQPPPINGLPESYRDLARLMNGDWISFIAKQDPNQWAGRSAATKTLGQPVPAWPRYAAAGKDDGCSSSEGAPEVFVFNGNTTCVTEKDTWRQEGLDLINSANKDVYDR